MQLWNLPVLDPLESTKATWLAGTSLCQARNKKGLQSTDRLTQERYQAGSTIDFTGDK